jgi:uncharacterized repeat protein (TIGR03806 family)
MSSVGSASAGCNEGSGVGAKRTPQGSSTRLVALRCTLLVSLFGSTSCGDDETLLLYSPSGGEPVAATSASTALAFPRGWERAPLPGEAADFPSLLSETGAFTDLITLEPSPGLLPYEVQSPLWSDGAFKRRWLALPDKATIHFSETGAWQFPEGSVFVKHFEMPLDEAHPEERRRLETRFWIVAGPDHQYGLSYKWNDSGTDAELLLGSQSEMLSISDAEGQLRSQPYFYPGPADCLACHSASAGFVLGVRTAQLNREQSYAPESPPINQLLALSGWGMLDAELDAEAAARAPQLSELTDASAGVEQRVRSYWDSNCSMCHAGSEGSVAGWDARFSTPLSEQGLGDAPKNGAFAGSQLIANGAPERSFILARSNSVEPALRMPPLGRNRVDSTYVELLRQWITSLGNEQNENADEHRR